MAEKEQVTPEEVDRAIKDANEISEYVQDRVVSAIVKMSITQKMENIIRVIVKLAGR